MVVELALSPLAAAPASPSIPFFIQARLVQRRVCIGLNYDLSRTVGEFGGWKEEGDKRTMRFGQQWGFPIGKEGSRILAW